MVADGEFIIIIIKVLSPFFMLSTGRTVPLIEYFYSDECCNSIGVFEPFVLLSGCPSWRQTKHINCNL